MLFKNTNTSEPESTGHVELAVVLSQSLPFKANLTLRAIDDTATGKLYSTNNIFMLY